ncbi:unnamed protein product [Linum tenue]|uniref:Uncharacterized protein n=1 Tax=Linum tenue TaxID=586396 RepID=A0AAV0PWC0_9ROSI|nr:unnamed protein product [Linum tenue]
MGHTRIGAVVLFVVVGVHFVCGQAQRQGSTGGEPIFGGAGGGI